MRLNSPCSPLCSRRGFTLLEVMVVVSILAVLVGLVVWAASRSGDSAKINQTKAMMEAMRTAISEFEGAGRRLPLPAFFDPNGATPGVEIIPPVTQLQGPPESERVDYYIPETSTTFGPTFSPMTTGSFYSGGFFRSCDASGNPDSPAKRIYGIQLLYALLNADPASRAVLSKLPAQSIARKGSENFPAAVMPVEKTASHLVFVNSANTPVPPAYDAAVLLDPWGQPLYYGRGTNVNNGMPYLQSAGPNRVWGDGDDVFSYERTR